jgi:hypothetical protein
LRKETSSIWDEIAIMEGILGFGEGKVVDEEEDEGDLIMAAFTGRREEEMFEWTEDECAGRVPREGQTPTLCPIFF